MVDILLVEDHPLMRPTLRDMLSLEGYVVHTAVHGLDALNLLDSGISVDLVVTDFLMPELDGLELLSRLRTDTRYQNLPILMFTAQGEAIVRTRALEMGANAFLTRPITAKELFGAVQKLLAKVAVH